MEGLGGSGVAELNADSDRWIELIFGCGLVCVEVLGCCSLAVVDGTGCAPMSKSVCGAGVAEVSCEEVPGEDVLGVEGCASTAGGSGPEDGAAEGVSTACVDEVECLRNRE
jgi:hypothetical protein